MNGTIRIAYLSNDLADPATLRRVETLLTGGAAITLAGFRRTERPVSAVHCVAALDLGQTNDGQLPRRAMRVASKAMARWTHTLFNGADVVLARNLDMLLFGLAARWRTRSHVPVVYECLDINQRMMGTQAARRALRRLDAYALSRSDGLLVSSPSFVSEYFSRLGVAVPPVILAENKLRPGTGARAGTPAASLQLPWRIGWFGNLRCTRSFEFLRDLAARWPRVIEVVLRGRPTVPVAELIERHLPCSGMRYEGLYTLDDLPALYAPCHFAWAIDYFDPTANSQWLLPNRIYEGSFFHVPAIARAGTATAAWLLEHDAGLIVDELDDLHGAIGSMISNKGRLEVLRKAVARIPLIDLVWTAASCQSLVSQIAHLSQSPNRERLKEIVNV
ncbi:MAG: hypothetical protein ACJ8AW_08485 [Rhodopila sp.]